MKDYIDSEKYHTMCATDKRTYDKIRELEVKNKQLEHELKQKELRLKEHYYNMEVDPAYRKYHHKKTKKSKFKKWLEFMFPWLED